MHNLPFTKSQLGTIGIELELQIIDKDTHNLAPLAYKIIQSLNEQVCKNRIKPEVTQGMIEINTSIHTSINTALKELQDLQSLLLLPGSSRLIK